MGLLKQHEKRQRGRRALMALSGLLVTSLSISACAPAKQSDSNAIHDRFLVLDSHLDTPIVLDRPGFDITRRHDALIDYAQVDLPRMREGGLDGGFWVIYTPQGALTAKGYANALAHARHRNRLIDKMLATHGDHFAAALRADDAAAIAAQGKRIVYKSIENAYPLGEDISRLDEFYAAGVRMVGLVHMANNQFADSATDPAGPKWGGLSPLGKALIRRANRLGMIVDLSHAHDAALQQAIELSTTPVILSHSGAAALYAHPRNVNDALLRDLAASGGVMHINSLSGYLKKLDTDPARRPALVALFRYWRQNPPQTEADTQAFLEARRAIDAQYRPDFASLDDVMAHIFHAGDIMGAAHIGIGLDWDGGGGVDGLHDIAALPAITARMRAAGISDKAIGQMWSGNVLRLLRLAENARRASPETEKNTGK
jgi:membrane dipeptidase